MRDLNISFLTLQVPPPFAHGYTISISKKESGWQVGFQLEYLQRDTLTEEEILEEGFSGADDFEWYGALPTVWVKTLDQLLDHTLLKPEKTEEAPNHLFLEYANNGKSGFPENLEAWEYLLEELIQAIYELAERELPFMLHIVRQKSGVDMRLEAKFATRQFYLKDSSNTYPWGQLKAVLAQIENFEIDENPKAKPHKKGSWLSFDGEHYYEIKSEGAVNKLRDTLESH